MLHKAGGTISSPGILPRPSPSSGSCSPPYKTPPSTPTHLHMLRERDPSPSRASISNDLPRIPPVLPVLPSSPPAPRYETLMKHLHPGNVRGGKKRTLEEGQRDEVERRVSVRQSESAFRYKDIVVKKCQGYTQIWLFTQTKRKNALNPKVNRLVYQGWTFGGLWQVVPALACSDHVIKRVS